VHWRAADMYEGQHTVVKHVRDIQPAGEEGTASGINLYRIEGVSSSRCRTITTSPSTHSSAAWLVHQAAARNLQGRLLDRGILACHAVASYLAPVIHEGLNVGRC
jgi:hypothetical protein